jgi:CTP:molybdopterin cytidylyltransferase MocA
MKAAEDTHRLKEAIPLRTAALVPVAGLSSRMGEFKPLLTLNGFTLIRLAVQSAVDGGVSQVCVITGREAERVREALANSDEGANKDANPYGGDTECQPLLSFVHNPDFATTDMLYSLKLGLHTLLETERQESGEAPVDAIFVSPADVAAVEPRSFGQLRERAVHSDAVVFQPSFHGKKGHPLLVRRPCFEAILSFDGAGGLREALKPFSAECVELADEGITLDADEAADFKRLSAYARGVKGLAPAVIKGLLNDAKTPQHIREHCRVVAELALRMARRLNIAGQCLDSELCRSAAALHDMNRLEQHHSQVAADTLRRLGYDAVARVVGAHDSAEGFVPDTFSESLVVFIADKLVRETERVTLEERYRPALKRFSAATDIGQRILRDKALCREAISHYEELTGDRLHVAE